MKGKFTRISVLLFIFFLHSPVMVPGDIIFVNMNIRRTGPAGDYFASIDNIRLVSGSIKEGHSIYPETKPGELRCSFLNADKKVIKSVNIPNPLSVLFDYTTNYVTLIPVEVKTDTASLVVRSNYSSDMMYLRIETPGGEQTPREICCLELNPSLFISSHNSTRALDGPTGIEALMYNGSDGTRIVFVILGDGYTESEQNKLIADAAGLSNYLFSEPVYEAYKNDFNMYAIRVISNVSGAAADPNNLIDNYFGSTFNYGGIQRLLVPTNTARLNNTLQTYKPDYDEAIVVVNSSIYGGSGGSFATVSIHTSSPEILLHELGHSFAGLSDEYWAGSEYARENINMTRNNDPATVRWKQFLGIDGVGIYEYESPGNGWFRPHQNCKMRYLNSPFCAVCRNAHIEKILSLLPGQTPVPTPDPTPIPTPTPLPQNYGDVNTDGAIDIVDALLTAQYYVGLNPQNFAPERADTNCNGSIDIVDALLIAQYYVGLITQFCS